MLYLEVKRLYFDYRKSHTKDKYTVVLDYIKEEEQPRNDFNLLDTRKIFLGEIDGCPRPYVRINLRKIKKNTTFHEKLQI